jgi:drug/metabolite transporter, DME family
VSRHRTRLPRIGRGAAEVAGAAALWGTAGTAQELLLPTAPPVAVAAIRCLVGGGVLLLIALGPSRRASLVTTVRHGGAPLWAATAAMTVFQACYLLGIRTAGVALGTLVALGSAPAWAGILAAATGRRPSTRWVAATVLAVAGLALLVRADTGAAPASGVALAAVAGAAYGTYTTTSSRLRVTDRGAVVAITFTVCGLVLSPAIAVTGGIPVDVDAVVGLAWLAVATTIVAYRLFLRGLTHLDAPAATTLSLVEPLTATLLAVTIVGEDLTALGVTGVVALLVGVAAASRPDAARPVGHLASDRPRTGSGP